MSEGTSCPPLPLPTLSHTYQGPGCGGKVQPRLHARQGGAPGQPGCEGAGKGGNGGSTHTILTLPPLRGYNPPWLCWPKRIYSHQLSPPTLSSPPLSLLQLTTLVALADQDRTFNLSPTLPLPLPLPPPSCMQLTTVVALASQDRTFSVWVCGETVPIVMSDERDKCFKQVCVWGGTGGG